jgi:hypothetical protein
MKTQLFSMFFRAAACLVLGLTGTVTRAQTIAFSNFAPPDAPVPRVEAIFTLNSDNWLDQAFRTTGADWATPLQSIAVKYSSFTNSPVFDARLYLGTPGYGGTLELSFTLLSPEQLSPSGGIATFVPVGPPLLLAADSTYWFVLGLKSGTFDWDYVADVTKTGSGTFPPASDPLTGFSADQGESWSLDSGFPQLPQYIEVTTAAIPEPAVCAGFMGLLAAALAVSVRRRASNGFSAQVAHSEPVS